MSIHVRPATKEDYVTLLPIAYEAQDKHVQAHPHIFQSGTAGLPEKYYLGLIKSGSKVVYVAEVEQSIVGYVIMELSNVAYLDILAPRQVAFIADIAVLKSHQGKGIGYALFQKCVEWAKAKEADSLDLMVWEFNKDAMAFYERQGMESMSRVISLGLK